MMFYDVLYLKNILGFLLSKRTSGVSPVIFILCLVCFLTTFYKGVDIPHGEKRLLRWEFLYSEKFEWEIYVGKNLIDTSHFDTLTL